MFAQESVMDIQKIKELALANGFSLKEQASGNMDLHSYVYEFANAIEQAIKAQAVPAEKNWDEIHLNPKERLYWSLRSAKKRKSDLNWHHASHQTCVGSTHGRKICEYLGVDPDGKDFVRTQEPAND